MPRGERRPWTRAGLAALGLVWLGLAGACAGPFERPGGRPVVGAYDQLTAAQTERYRSARRSCDSGDLATARALVTELRAAAPDHIALGILEQEILFAELGAEARAELERRASSDLQAQPDVTRLVLAARVAQSAQDARALLVRAAALDRRCAWAHYGLAHAGVRSGAWSEAHEGLALALEIDPYLPPARRLQAMLLARDGRRPEAIDAYETWLEDVADDPRVGLRELVESQLDLATLYVLEHDEDAARELLTELSLDGDLAVRALCVLAAAEQGAGRPEEALHATRAAQQLAPDASLPWEQEALLCQSWLDDPAGAEAAWRRLLESSPAGGDLGRVLVSMRARLALERAERRRLRAAGSAGAAP